VYTAVAISLTATWNHTVLTDNPAGPAVTTFPPLPRPSKPGTWFSDLGGTQGWVNL